MSRYSKEQIEQMKQVVENLRRADPNVKQSQIAEAFNKMHFKTTLGKKFASISIHNFLKNHAKHVIGKRRRHPILPRHLDPQHDDTLEVAKFIIAARLDTLKKKNLLRSIFS